jgi:hypothetical protein
MIPENVLPALVGAFVGGIVTMLGWLINYYLGRNKDIEIRQREARIRHIQQQIEEFYAPLWSLAEQSRIIHDIARQRLPSREDGMTDKSRFTTQDSEIYSFFNENYYMRINLEIAEIIRKKIYLLQDGVMPESFHKFIEHQAISETLYQLWKQKGIDSTAKVPGRGFPIQFGVDVKDTLDQLRQKYTLEIKLTTNPSKSRSKV